ncbi:MAG: hypothetical protein ACRDPE_11740 [Solirubrobacterales bacterium]
MADGSESEGKPESLADRVEQLNNDFFSRSPSDYFLFRLRNLVLSASHGLDLERLVARGVEVGDFTLGEYQGDLGEALDDEQEEAQHSFVTLETEVLLHHVSETLLRLYLVLEQRSPCPWLAMSRERSPRRFKRKVESLVERLGPDGDMQKMSWVFFGAADHRTFGDEALTDELWAELVESSRSWLSWFASYMLDADVYNAAKHGLGVYPQRMALSVEVDGQPLFDGSGPCLEYLHEVRGENDGRAWRRGTKWVHWDHLFGAIHIACQLIERLWIVGRVHYGESARLDLELAVFARPADLFRNDGITLTKFSRSLGIDTDLLP